MTESEDEKKSGKADEKIVRRVITPLDRAFGARLARMRRNADLTQDQMTSKLQKEFEIDFESIKHIPEAKIETIEKQTFSHYERGYARPTAYRLSQVARILKCSTSYLLCETDEVLSRKNPELNRAFNDARLGTQKAIEMLLLADRNQDEEQADKEGSD